MQQVFSFALSFHNAHIEKLITKFATSTSWMGIILLAVHDQEEQFFIKKTAAPYSISVVDFCRNDNHDKQSQYLFTHEDDVMHNAVIWFNLDAFLTKTSSSDRVASENEISSILDRLFSLQTSVLIALPNEIIAITMDLQSRLSRFYTDSIRYG